MDFVRRDGGIVAIEIEIDFQLDAIEGASVAYIRAAPTNCVNLMSFHSLASLQRELTASKSSRVAVHIIYEALVLDR